MVDDLFQGSLVLLMVAMQNFSPWDKNCQNLYPGKSLLSQFPKGEPSFPILGVYTLHFSLPQGKTQAKQGNMSGNTTIIGYTTAIDCSQSPIFLYDRQDHWRSPPRYIWKSRWPPLMVRHTISRRSQRKIGDCEESTTSREWKFKVYFPVQRKMGVEIKILQNHRG